MNFDAAMAARPLIAILRGVRPEEVVSIGAALIDAGFSAAEVPLNSPQAFTSIERLAHACGAHLAVGAGTVLTEEDALRTAQAGAGFIVTPNTDAAVIRAALAQGVKAAPGFATPTEAFAAIAAGARDLKLFPAATYGPGHLSALRAVLPRECAVYAVGGVTTASLQIWLKAGARGFGIGSDLYKPGAPAGEVHRRASVFVDAFEAAKTADR